MVEKIFVREYLESLKEDRELDLIFTLLLDAMGFQVVKTPKESKGQSQYGKDTIAIGPDTHGVRHAWYFELKGYDDKDIDQRTFTKDDGIKDSLIEAKYAVFEATGIPDFNSLSKKIVLVHNGVTKENFRPTFEGFIKTEFGESGFEDWDVNRLTDLFSQHLFSEYLLADSISVRLFKRILVYLDVPDYELTDLGPLLDHLFLSFEQAVNKSKSSNKKGNRRLREKLLATMNLLGVIIFHYSREIENLFPAKQALAQLVLRTWHFILVHKAESDKNYLKYFNQLLLTQKRVLESYFDKSVIIAQTSRGLFTSEGFAFEPIGYPLRCFTYLDDLVYYFRLNNSFIHSEEELFKAQSAQKEIIRQIVVQNDGCFRPLLDSHSITIIHTLLFFAESNFTESDLAILCQYIRDCLQNILIRKRMKSVYPMIGYDLEKLADLEVYGIKPDDYEDGASLLIPILIELVVILDLPSLYQQSRTQFLEEPNLQTAYFTPDSQTEQLLFIKNMSAHYWVETNISLPEDMDAFREKTFQKMKDIIPFRTQKAGYNLLLVLAQSFYKNEPHPNEWRVLLKVQKEE